VGRFWGQKIKKHSADFDDKKSKQLYADFYEKIKQLTDFDEKIKQL